MKGCAVCKGDLSFLRCSKRREYESIKPQLRVVDLFCGCGGLSLGIAEAAREIGFGIKIRAAVDEDSNAASVYQKNFPGANVIRSAVEALFDGQLGSPLTPTEQEFAKRVGKVDVLIGGPPCQGHSDLNNHTRRSDPRNALYGRMARAAAVLNPTVLLIENVPTIRHDVGAVIHITKAALTELDYAVHDSVLDLGKLGAPQRRRRHVLLGIRGASPNPKQLLESVPARCEKHGVRPVRWAIADLLGVSEGIFDTSSKASQENAQRISFLFKKHLYDLPNRLRPKCHHSDHSYFSMYGRLRWNEPAQTVTTGFGSMGQGRYVHPLRQRTITPHEAARLQMLPDFFDWTDVTSRGVLASLVGNAVPPALGMAVGKAVFGSIWRSKNEMGQPSAPLKESENTQVPKASSEAAARRMRATRQSDTEIELILKSELAAAGLRCQCNKRPVPHMRSRADFIFPTARVAVFVDGCFWHGCPKHGTSPKCNGSWWRAKLAANKERDSRCVRLLRRAGWTVLRFWEHEVKEDATRVANVVTRRVRGRFRLLRKAS